MTRPAPSADLLDRLAQRFGSSPGHAAWRALQAEAAGRRDVRPPAPAPRQASVNTGIPAVWSAYG